MRMLLPACERDDRHPMSLWPYFSRVARYFGSFGCEGDRSYGSPTWNCSLPLNKDIIEQGTEGHQWEVSFAYKTTVRISENVEDSHGVFCSS